ncbi:MAG: hypothetical protein ACC742_03585 [Thermoanaerobaculales bacterium]
MQRRILVLATLVLLLSTAATAGEDTRWINVNVTEPATNTNVEVHLPLSLVLTVLRNVNVKNFHGGQIDLDLDDMDVNWLEIMAAVKEAPDGKFVTVTSDEADVNVRKEGGTLYVNVNEKGGDNAVVEVTLPLQMMDALTLGETSTIDVAALLESFDTLPNGTLVKVTSDEANVRVWIQ